MSDELIVIDGSQGEGGGQILRSSLTLSLCAGRPVRIETIRAGRRKPGLLRQHLACVRAAAAISGAEVCGGELGSTELEFAPGELRAGEYRFEIGSAGSTTLVLQTVWPALLRADGPSRVNVTGGTDNPMAPPVRFLQEAFWPLMRRMGADVAFDVVTRGFYPAGGGEVSLSIQPGSLRPLELVERGALLGVRAEAAVSRLSIDIAKREQKVLEKKLRRFEAATSVLEILGSPGPGNVVTIAVESEHVTEVMSAIGEKRKRAEAVAADAAGDVKRYLAGDVAVGEYLADQLLLPMALAGGRSLTTLEPSQHTRTQAAVIEQFLPVRIAMRAENAAGDRSGDGRRWRLDVAGL